MELPIEYSLVFEKNQEHEELDLLLYSWISGTLWGNLG
jgi:hypothetical protein